MYYVGLDVHSNSSSLEILDHDGKTFKRLDVKGPWEAMLRRIEELPAPRSICYEASCGYGYLHDRLSKLAQRVAVAHPRQLQLIYRSKRKNNRVDAGKLAKLLYLDMVPQVHVPNIGVRNWRAMIEFRQKLLGRRTAVKNQLHAILRGHGIKAPRNLWYGPGLAWLKNLADLDSFNCLQRDMLLEELSELDGKIKRVQKELAKLASAHPAVTLLRTIPGVGIRTAEAFVAYVDDIGRFCRTSQLGVYFGLVPCQDASADKNRLGHITRDGPSTVRKVLCESAWQAVRHSPTIKAWFDRITGGDDERRKIAIVAVARKLSVVMGAMMRSGETWRESQ
jgi:transposase